MFSLLVFIVFLIVKSNADIEDFFYFGCYRSVETLSQKHSGTSSFFDDCINLCYKQETDYAGVNARECFCGNEITNDFRPLNKTDCEVCFQEPYIHSIRYCGGPDSLSVYKLVPASASNTAILFATDKNVEMWGLENSVKAFDELLLGSHGIASVAYKVDWGILYVSGDKIFRFIHDGVRHYSMEFSYIDVRTTCHQIVDVAIDWVSNSIFWACPDQKSINWISRISDGRLLINSGDVQSFMIEPYRKFILFTNATGLAKYNFNTNKTDILTLSLQLNIKHISLDVQKEQIFLIHEEESEKYLSVTDYNFKKLKILLHGERISNPFELDAVNGTVCWGNQNDDKYTVYKSQVACSDNHESCELVNVTMLFTQTEKINDFKMYTRDAERPSTNYLCERKRCSHMCIRLSAYEVGCRCPDGLATMEDGTTCIQQLPTSPTTSTDPPNPPKTIFTTESADNINQPTKPTLDTIWKKLKSYLNFGYTFFIVSHMILVVTVIFIIFLSTRQQRIIRSMNNTQQSKSEMVELS